MHLKTLSLVGFKSFADRTRLDFEPGVNVVVGPNGTGKSNIVDAISWVMGTQATSALRTARMDDVIFSGTAIRPAHSRAEVILTFDNSEGMFPLDLAEVSITRRLHRDGTSEYEINGTPCRLLDVQELLADSRVGRHQHVIVAQGRIDSILSSSPLDHRSVIEEAAGVVKHRNRRDRSIRRLDQTDGDVKRLKDILAEKQKRIRPLRRQAKAAERYDAVRAEARSLQLYLGGEALRAIRARLAEAEADRARLAALVATAGKELADLTASLERLEATAGEAGDALEFDTAAAARLETTAERLHRIATVARERRLAIEARLRDARSRRQDLEMEAEAIELEESSAAEEERQARSRAERAETHLRSLEDEERSIAEQAQLPLEGVAASLRGDLRALEAARERDEREARSLAHRAEVVAARLADEETELGRLDGEIRAADAEVSIAQDLYARARDARQRAQQEWELADEEAHRAEFELSHAQARVEAIEAALVGLGDPKALDRASSSKLVIGTVTSLLDVSEALEPAVRAALESWADALVVANRGDIDDVVADLRSEGLGGVPLVTRLDGPVESPARKVAAEWGVDALVDRLGPAADQDLAAVLLGDVLLLEGWTTAWQMVQRHPAVRAVTPEGDLITAFGVKSGDGIGMSPVALEEARAGVIVAEREAARCRSLQASTRRSFDLERDSERAALESLEVLEARVAGASEALALLNRTIGEGKAETARLDDRRRALAEERIIREERLSELRSRLVDLEADGGSAPETWEAMRARRDELNAKRDEARRGLQQATIAAAGIEERRRLLAQRAGEIARLLAGSGDGPSDDPARLGSVERRAQEALGTVRSHIATLRERQRHLREKAGDAGGRLSQAHGRQRDLERTVADGKDQLSILAVEIAELRVRLEAVAEGLRRDADASEEEALSALWPDGVDQAVDPKELLQARQAELRRMGPVNPLAATEYRELSGEVDFLTAQLSDLEGSRAELRKVIKALDEEIGKLFVEAFADIAARFEENFTLLFPGGKGRLSLTDPAHPLETGVELMVQPLGKRVNRLSLLSGGERSLAALAFLFAVFRSRPSPFYILDEVEAALDDANLRRFLRLIGVLGESAQLVVITHQQQTMEAADILYGVTMEPGESSTVLAKRLSQVNL